MTSLHDLLPGPDEAIRCAEHSRRLGIDPGGTAIRADRVVLIETPQPWPKPVFDHPALVGVKPILDRSRLATRVLAAAPVADQPPAATNPDPPRPVVVFDRSPEGAIERRFEPAGTAELLALAGALADDDGTGTGTPLDRLAIERRQLTEAVLLVCTQGSHDVCCGSEGARFAAEAEGVGGLRVHRVSHTGGHRFAPTAMTLPDGRMWAELDGQLLRHLVTRTGDPADLASHCRGWWGATTGPAQIAERAVFAEVGWDLDALDRSVEVGETIDGAIRCVVTAGDRRWEVLVAVAREVPTIACRQPGGLPAKPSVEYEVRRIRSIGRPARA